jgi:hypothetical protein
LRHEFVSASATVTTNDSVYDLEDYTLRSSRECAGVKRQGAAPWLLVFCGAAAGVAPALPLSC